MENLVGLTLKSAKENLKDRDYRIVRIDGVGMMITCDFRTDRVNLEVENNIIVKTYNG